jgi:hypothetical protein
MIQSIQASNTSLYSSIGTVTATAKVTTGKAETTPAAAQNEDENTVTSSQGDTLTISMAGVKAAKTFTAESANRPSVTGTSEDTYTDATATALSSAASNIGITEYTSVQNENSANAAAVNGSSSSASSSSSSSNLSEYSESELKEMLEDGEITRAEYEAEINSRKQTDATSDDDSETDTDVDAADGTDKTEDE